MTSLTRRKLLAAFLGLPAISGCQSERFDASETPPLPPGELVGASVSVGHRLRDGVKTALPEDERRETQVVIVGGGVAGLSAARRLLAGGVEDFVLLELERVPGGTSRSGRSSVVNFPWGAHYVPAPTHENPELVNLFEEMGVFEGKDEQGDPIVAEQFRCRFPEERVYYRGKWYEGLYLHAGASPEDKRQLARFQQEVRRWVAWRDSQNRRAFTLPMAAGSDDSAVTELDSISMETWCDRHGFTSPRLRWLIDYACRDDYGMRLHQTSAWAGLFYFASRIPAADASSRPFITWPEGNGRIIQFLHQRVRRQTLLGWAAADIRPVNAFIEKGEKTKAIDVISVSHDGKSVQGFRASHVIFAAPQFLAKYLIAPYRDNSPSHTSAFEYGAWMVANLTLTEPPTSVGYPLAWDNVLYESPSLGYVCATHQRGMDYGPSVLTYYYPLCDDNVTDARYKLLQLERDEWAEIALADLERAHFDVRQKARRLDVMRWGHAMIRPRVGFMFGGARQAAARSFRGIHFAHSDLSGLALFEEAFYRGTQAAEEVLKERPETGSQRLEES